MFNKDIDRYHTNSLKYDFKKEKKKPDDVLPMWVADMDFSCPEEVLEDLHNRVNHGIFGYSKMDEDYFYAIKSWYQKYFKTTLEKEWLIPTPGVVFALSTALKTLTNEGDSVLICNPVYYPFSEVILDNKRKLVSSNLILDDGHYVIDFADFEEKIKTYSIKLFLLCSPHNPVGRVWTKKELDTIISICRKYKVYIVSDEIHSDFIWKREHICLLSYSTYKDFIILCTSPSKTFNLAGLQVANIFIPNPIIREKFQTEVWNTGYSLINTMGLVACKSAYLKGEKWLRELKLYLFENISYVATFLKERLPKIKLIYPEGTYLLWLDFRDLRLSDKEIEDILLYKAKLWLDSGNMFGKLGEGFQRMNIALPREKLKKALEQLENAFKDI